MEGGIKRRGPDKGIFYLFIFLNYEIENRLVEWSSWKLEIIYASFGISIEIILYSIENATLHA